MKKVLEIPSALQGVRRRSAVAVMLCILMFLGCKNQSEVNDDFLDEIAVNGDQLISLNLKGTKWKLMEIANFQLVGSIKILEPKKCDDCYTLTFDTDSTATVFSVNWAEKLDFLHLGEGILLFEFNSPNKIFFCEKYFTDGEDYCDSYFFRRGIAYTKSFIVYPQNLKLFFPNKNNCLYSDSYLLFKLLK